MPKAPAIGIDLGTTNSCVGVYEAEKGKIEIIANEHGNRTTPSVVAFTERECLVGEAARSQTARNPDNTLYDVKRLIGRKVVKDGRWLFKLIPGDRKLKIPVTYKGKAKEYKPKEISAMVLTKMKKTAENYIGKTIKDAVITVPAYFTSKQTKATLKAGKIAGFNVLKLCREPAAATVAYGIHRQVGEKKNVFVFDLGGGTFDISILEAHKHTYATLAVNGDTELGGRDFDDKMVDHFVKDFKKKFEIDISSAKRALHKLRAACEKAKVHLSFYSEAMIDIEIMGKDYQATITRALFDELTKDLVARLEKPMETALKDDNLNKDDIDEVVLVGGSTRIVKIQELVKTFFGGKEPKKDINPDEAVAYGAAAIAARLHGEDAFDLTKDLVLQDVIPLSLGVEIRGGIMSTILSRNTPIPVKITKSDYSTADDFQTRVSFPVYEGERSKITDNYFLDEFCLDNLPSLPQGQLTFDVTFDIDINGILKVTARDSKSGQEKTITVNKGQYSSASVERMIQESIKCKEDDESETKRILAKNELENQAYKLKSNIKETDTNYKNRLAKIQKVLDWIHGTPLAPEKYIRDKIAQLGTI